MENHGTAILLSIAARRFFALLHTDLHKRVAAYPASPSHTRPSGVTLARTSEPPSRLNDIGSPNLPV
jgi:hypothetical protein